MSDTLTDEELADLIDGFYAYEQGCVDSGIHDEVRKAEAKKLLENMGRKKRQAFLCTMVWERCLCPNAREQGYGLEDAKSFLDWLDEWIGLAETDYRSPGQQR